MHRCILENKSENLILITVSSEEKNKIEWCDGDEFRLNGKMYDIVKRKQEGNILYLYCYSDSKEDYLFASLDDHIKNHIDHSTTGKNSKTKFKNPVPDFYKLADFGRINNPDTGHNKKTKNTTAIQDALIEFPSPPPRLV